MLDNVSVVEDAVVLDGMSGAEEALDVVKMLKSVKMLHSRVLGVVVVLEVGRVVLLKVAVVSVALLNVEVLSVSLLNMGVLSVVVLGVAVVSVALLNMGVLGADVLGVAVVSVALPNMRVLSVVVSSFMAVLSVVAFNVAEVMGVDSGVEE